MFERLLLAALGIAVLVVAAPEAQGKSGFPITICGQTVITNAVLTQDLTCTISGVVVGAPGITIDLGGHTFRGDYSAHYGVDDTGGFDKVTVKNGVLRNFEKGIYATGADLFSVSNVIASGNNSAGIEVAGVSASIASSLATGNFIGFAVTGNGASVRSSTATGNLNAGINVTGGQASIQAATSSGNGGGIYITGGQGSVRSSTASGNRSGYGIFFNGNFASIQSSTVMGNGGDGIYLFGDASRLKGNHADGNGYLNGVSDSTGVGIFATNYLTPPVGTNSAHGNDDPAECSPALLC